MEGLWGVSCRRRRADAVQGEGGPSRMAAAQAGDRGTAGAAGCRRRRYWSARVPSKTGQVCTQLVQARSIRFSSAIPYSNVVNATTPGTIPSMALNICCRKLREVCDLPIASTDPLLAIAFLMRSAYKARQIVIPVLAPSEPPRSSLPMRIGSRSSRRRISEHLNFCARLPI